MTYYKSEIPSHFSGKPDKHLQNFVMILIFWVLVPCRLVGRNILSPSSGLTSALKWKKVCFPETLATTDDSTRRRNPEEHHHPYRRENLTSHIELCVQLRWMDFISSVYVNPGKMTENSFQLHISYVIKIKSS
jgi:hypothetical protein